MPNIPSSASLTELLAWMEQHSTIWATSPTAIGITPAMASAFAAIVESSRKDFDNANAQRLASKQATVARSESFRTMRREASDLVNTIKSFIEQSGNTALWAQAGLEPPAPRGTTPPPNAPTDLSATLDSEGNLNLKWKASQPRGVSGVVYFIKRSLNNSGTFTQLDTVGEKKFTDSTVPSGATSVDYIVTAKRGGQQSAPSSTLSIRFGRGTGGGLTIVHDTARARAA